MRLLIAIARPSRPLARRDAMVSLALLAGLALPAAAAGPGQEPRRQAPGREGIPKIGDQLDPRRAIPEMTTVPSDLRDQAHLFSEDAVRSAREALERLERKVGAPVLIETIDSLGGERIDEVAIRLAHRSGTQGIFILVAKQEHKLEALPSRRYRDALPRDARDRVRAAFIEPFRERNFNEGLRRGIAALEEELRTAAMEGRMPQAEKANSGGEVRGSGLLRGSAGTSQQPARPAQDVRPGTLVRRDRIHLTLEGARVIIAAAARQAAAMNLKVNIAVVDDGGHLLSFDRMDDARPASGYTAITKATAAATFRQATGPLPAGTANPDPLLNLSLQLAAQASGGKVTTLNGGVPVVVDEQVIGAVGVGGGSGEQDATVARAGIQALVDSLKREGAVTPSAERR
jgi:glc operon protein GlcG